MTRGRRTVDEDVVALEVAVDDVVLVQVGEPVENLTAPLLDHLALDALGHRNVPAEEG